MSNNPFTLTFGKRPISFIERGEIKNKVLKDFNLDNPFSYTYLITGLRGSGKTVLLANIVDELKKDNKWIVVNVNPEKEILEQIASEIYENTSMKHLFTSKSFSLGFRGVSFSIEGKEPVSNVNSLINKMLDFVVKHNKKVLIAIDEVSNNSHLKTFIQDYQIMIRNNYPVFLLMTGLSENINALQNNKTLTFLLRAPKLIVNSLNIEDIEEKYRTTFSSNDNIKELAVLTNGYAFAYQVVGYLFFKYRKINTKFLEEFDDYLSVYVYDKVFESLPEGERKFLKLFKEDTIQTSVLYKTGNVSMYRDRLIKKGILVSSKRGEISIALPRFSKYIEKHK